MSVDLATYVQDDRGRKRPLATIVPDEGEPIDVLCKRQSALDAALDSEKGVRRRPHEFPILLISGIVVLVPLAVGPVVLWNAPTWWPITCLLTVSTIGGVWFDRRTRRRNARRVAGLHIDEGRCASCTYPLQCVPPASDGCTVCPECGAAWKIPGHTAPVEVKP